MEIQSWWVESETEGRLEMWVNEDVLRLTEAVCNQLGYSTSGIYTSFIPPVRVLIMLSARRTPLSTQSLQVHIL